MIGRMAGSVLEVLAISAAAGASVSAPVAASVDEEVGSAAPVVVVGSRTATVVSSSPVGPLQAAIGKTINERTQTAVPMIV